ncbi:MAG: DUF3795 domain-containing protein, partial [Candidatus Heimdallarchaeota archaeon]
MNEAISLCGFNCGICPAFKPNIRSDEDRLKVDEGWKKFHRTRGWIYKEPYCAGCFNIPDKPPLWSTCYIRRCVLTNNVENCGKCADYLCPRIKNMIHATKAIAKRTEKTGTPEEYQEYAFPYLNETRLEAIHQQFIKTTYTPEVQSVNTSTVRFPVNLNQQKLSGIQTDEGKLQGILQSLHSTLESMMTLHCKTPGGQEQELKLNKESTKFLWIIGRYGRLLADEELQIEITLKELKNHLKYGKYRVKKKLQELTEHKIDGDFLEDRIQIRFSEEPEMVIALQNYINILLEKSTERRAYSKFWKADMSVFS